jgi:hypothetical protein
MCRKPYSNADLALDNSRKKVIIAQYTLILDN